MSSLTVRRLIPVSLFDGFFTDIRPKYQAFRIQEVHSCCIFQVTHDDGGLPSDTICIYQSHVTPIGKKKERWPWNGKDPLCNVSYITQISHNVISYRDPKMLIFEQLLNFTGLLKNKTTIGSASSNLTKAFNWYHGNSLKKWINFFKQNAALFLLNILIFVFLPRTDWKYVGNISNRLTNTHFRELLHWGKKCILESPYSNLSCLL